MAELTAFQERIRSLLDLHVPLTDHEKWVMAKVYGQDRAPAPDPRPSPHDPGCWCLRCWNAGIEYGVYLHNKRMKKL